MTRQYKRRYSRKQEAQRYENVMAKFFVVVVLIVLIVMFMRGISSHKKEEVQVIQTVQKEISDTTSGVNDLDDTNVKPVENKVWGFEFYSDIGEINGIDYFVYTDKKTDIAYLFSSEGGVTPYLSANGKYQRKLYGSLSELKDEP